MRKDGKHMSKYIFKSPTLILVTLRIEWSDSFDVNI